ncbi:serine/threonine-protein kinase [Kitasatospora gansuensis]
MKALQDGDPRRVGPYELLGVLGAGGMGRVYLGRLGEVLVAVKVINEELTQNGDFIARFRREVTATRAMSGPYFAAIVDHDVDAEQPWLATEYVPGPTLNAVIAEHGPLDVVSVRALGVRLAQALGAIHAAGLVHRDVKPGNILLGADGPRLIDFGIARGAAVTTLTQTGVVLGTPQFMAPEQLQVRGRVTAAADVFALGLVLAFAATGEHPFGQTDSFAFGFRIVHEEPDLEQVPADLAGAVRRCLAKDPGERPTPGQLGAMLGLGEETLDRSGLAVLIRHAGDTEIPSPPRTPTERNHVERPPRRRRAPIALAAVVAVAVGTAVTVALAPGGGTPQGLGPTGTSPTGSAVSVTPTAPTASADPGSPTATTPPPPSPRRPRRRAARPSPSRRRRAAPTGRRAARPAAQPAAARAPAARQEAPGAPETPRAAVAVRRAGTPAAPPAPRTTPPPRRPPHLRPRPRVRRLRRCRATTRPSTTAASGPATCRSP